MNTRFIGWAAILPLFVVGMAMASGTTIMDTAHNFSEYNWAGSEVCKPCHTPHNALGNTISGRLWNHDLSTATYTIHKPGGATGESLAGVSSTDALDRVSRLCMGCHDGTVALDSFGGASGSTLIGTIGNGRRDLGTDLSNDHPLGNDAIYKEEYKGGGGATFSYKSVTSVNAAGLRLVTKLASDGTTIPRTYSVTGDQIQADGSLQNQTRAGTNVSTLVLGCSTCHGVHGTGNSHLLRASNAGSALCLACHNK